MRIGPICVGKDQNVGPIRQTKGFRRKQTQKLNIETGSKLLKGHPIAILTIVALKKSPDHCIVLQEEDMGG